MSHLLTIAENGHGKGHGHGHATGDPAAPTWPSFKGTAQFVGTSQSGRVSVFVDPTLGAPALRNAHDLLADSDRIVRANDAIFGTTGGNVSVIVFALGGETDGTGGADHLGCDYVNGNAIEVCASFGNSVRVSALFEAELSECSMGGNLCGESTGEALSRCCAAAVSNNALADFATAPAWAQSGMPDFVNKTDPTDQNAVSTGCALAFLSWLVSKGFPLNTIAPAMTKLGDSGTLAQLYANLTSDAARNAWPAFLSAVKALPGGVTNDDPFAGASSSPSALSHFAPWTADLAGKIFGAILTDVAAGKSDENILASVRNVLAAQPAQPAHEAAAVQCSIKSHRLRGAAPTR